jgi:hypothetical protein
VSAGRPINEIVTGRPPFVIPAVLRPVIRRFPPGVHRIAVIGAVFIRIFG